MALFQSLWMNKQTTCEQQHAKLQQSQSKDLKVYRAAMEQRVRQVLLLQHCCYVIVITKEKHPNRIESWYFEENPTTGTNEQEGEKLTRCCWMRCFRRDDWCDVWRACTTPDRPTPDRSASVWWPTSSGWSALAACQVAIERSDASFVHQSTQQHLINEITNRTNWRKHMQERKNKKPHTHTEQLSEISVSFEEMLIDFGDRKSSHQSMQRRLALRCVFVS